MLAAEINPRTSSCLQSLRVRCLSAVSLLSLYSRGERALRSAHIGDTSGLADDEMRQLCGSSVSYPNFSQ
jgi:hypothetical protein